MKISRMDDVIFTEGRKFAEFASVFCMHSRRQA